MKKKPTEREASSPEKGRRNWWLGFLKLAKKRRKRVQTRGGLSIAKEGKRRKEGRGRQWV